MRDGLKYNGHNHEKAIKRLYTINNLMIYLAENAPKFTPEEMCRDIIPAMLKPRARVEYVNLGGEELTERRDVISLIQTNLRGQTRATAVATMTAAAAAAAAADAAGPVKKICAAF